MLRLREYWKQLQEGSIKHYSTCLFLIFAVSFAIRIFLWLRNPAMWCDEAALAYNICYKSFSELLKGLDFMQASPAFFTIIVKALNLFIKQPYARDLTLRSIPLASGILAIPAFYYLVKNVFNDKKFILVSLFLFAFNPCAILYSVQLKQYSTELLISVILSTLFYKILVQNKFKYYYFVITALSFWFSYSAFFIIAAGFLLLLFKNKRQFIRGAMLSFASFVLYYFISLKYVFSVNYAGMNTFWSNAYSFLCLKHPTRVIYRIGELFGADKITAFIAGAIILYAIVKYLFSEKFINTKLLFLLPLLFTVLASMLHLYPFCPRLILFLLPISILCLSYQNGILKFIITIIMFFSLPFYSYTPDAKEFFCSFARDIAEYVSTIPDKDAFIILEKETPSYDFYMHNKRINNRIIRLPLACEKEFVADCAKKFKNLPQGHYYFLSETYYAMESAAKYNPKALDLEYQPKEIKAIYFEKGEK